MATTTNPVARRAAVTTARVLAAAYRSELLALKSAVEEVHRLPGLEFLRVGVEQTRERAVELWEALVLAASDLDRGQQEAALLSPHPTSYPFAYVWEIPEVPEVELPDREPVRLVDTEPCHHCGVVGHAPDCDEADDAEREHDHSDRRVCQGIGCVYGDH